ncbi:MAG: pectin acetylesterase-family hydrolase [Patescibacteria group bacterium]
MKNPFIILFASALATLAAVGIFYALQGPGDPDDFISLSELSRIERTNKMVKYEVENAKERGAVSNDGSPAVYYYRTGADENADKWIIHLQGGGSCNSEEECIERWKTQQFRMTSKNYSKYMTGSGIVSPDPDKNPDFYNFNHVYVKYSSSDVWSGNNEVEIEGRTVYFHGARIVDAVLEDLQNENIFPGQTINDATDVLLTGSSAGGVGVMRNLDHVAETLSWAEVRGVNDSAWNLVGELTPPEDWEPISDLVKEEVYEFHNPRLDQSCIEANPDDPFACIGSPYMYEYVETPFFLYIDQVDHNSLSFHGKLTVIDIDDRSDPVVMEYREQNAQNIKNSIADLEGVFSTRTGRHTALTGPYFFTLEVDGYTYQEVFTNWYLGLEGPTHVVKDGEIW